MHGSAYHLEILTSKLAGRGAIAAIGATIAEVTSMLEEVVGGKGVIACINSSSLMTVLGDIDPVDSLQKLAPDANIFARRLKVDTAYHSRHMREVEAEYLIKLGGITPNLAIESSPRFNSSLRGKQVALEELKDTYWCENLTSTVLFSQAVINMCRERKLYSFVSPIDVIVEIGPYSSLKVLILEILESRSHSSGNSARYLPILLRDSDPARSFLHTVGVLYCIDCSAEDPDQPYKMLSDLPQYPCLHTKRYWHESRISKNSRFRRFPRRFPQHNLVSALVEDFNELEPRWRTVIRLSEIPWLPHHLIQSSVLFPFAAYVSMARSAAF